MLKLNKYRLIVLERIDKGFREKCMICERSVINKPGQINHTKGCPVGKSKKWVYILEHGENK